LKKLAADDSPDVNKKEEKMSMWDKKNERRPSLSREATAILTEG
jgi:hypothetical protein